LRTERLFDHNSYQTEFSADVVRSRDVRGKQGIILDQTIFFPNSGGQPSDQGTIENIPVMDVFEENDEIVHVLENELLGRIHIKGKIDWNRRFDHIQQHSGQHILSQVFVQTLNAETIGFHLGTESSSIDLNIDSLSREDGVRTEVLANHVVFENRKVIIHILSSDELQHYPLRKIPQTDQRIRVVEIKGFDWSGCCGTHVRMTGEIGLIKIIGWERYKNGLRIHFLCGERSLKDYLRKIETVKETCRMLTIGESEIIPTLIRLQEEKKIQEKKIQHLLDRAMEQEASLFYEKSIMEFSYRLITEIFVERDINEVQALVKKLIRFPDVVVLIGLQKDRGYLYFARSPSIHVDMRNLLEEVIQEMDGKGGGSATMAQGSGADPSRIQEAINRAKQVLATKYLHQ
jgi:alanyl-tRNA synthetase